MSETEIALETGAFRRGPGGRPSRQEAERRHRELLQTAKRLLLERGWEATSIDEICRQSGVAKRFLYARYPDKTALFVAAVAQYRDEQIGALDVFKSLPEDPEEGLLKLGRLLLRAALSEEAIALGRLFLTEAARLRDRAAALFEDGRRRGMASITQILEAYAARGALDVADPQMAAEHFFILIVALPQRLAMIGYREPEAQHERRLLAAVRLFLDGCRAKGGPTVS